LRKQLKKTKQEEKHRSNDLRRMILKVNVEVSFMD